MELRLYDTLTREKRVFAPIDPARVRMYVCGPTVYDFAHIGNARPLIVFDVLFRLLRHIYGADHVTYVRNVTDVDDKINARAAERGVSIRDLTEETYEKFKKDVKAIKCEPPTIEPRATEHIEEMKALIERLVKSKNAYIAEDNVLFNVPSMPDYGQLSKRPLDEMIAGARVEVVPYKKDPQDFVLWKPSKPGEPSWPSPAGIKTPGRPGWHIECSAMAWKHLGETFDIHGGGIDLVFPHHENEIAQSRCAFHTGIMANYWMHNGFLQVEGEKMSKSLENFYTIRQLYRTKDFGGRKWNGNILKFAMLQTHYRQPIDWSIRLLEQAESRLESWLNFTAERTVRRANKELFSEFVGALLDDLNTPFAFSIIDRVVNSAKASDSDRFTVYKVLKFFGLRGKQTRVAKAAANFESMLERLQSIPPNKWKQIAEAARNADIAGDSAAKYEAAVRLAVMLDVVTKYWSDLGIENKWSEQFVNSAEDDSRHYWQSRNLNSLGKTFDNRIKELGHFSKSDWNNFLVTVLDRPRFTSGNLKPETKLFTYLRVISNLHKSLLLNLQFHSPHLRELREQLLAEAKPAESDLELQIRRLIAEREKARSERRFADADRIRNQIAAMGVVLKDSKDGTTWEIAR
jgi:cysteinyl-tRNA synthetase